MKRFPILPFRRLPEEAVTGVSWTVDGEPLSADFLEAATYGTSVTIVFSAALDHDALQASLGPGQFTTRLVVLSRDTVTRRKREIAAIEVMPGAPLSAGGVLILRDAGSNLQLFAQLVVARSNPAAGNLFAPALPGAILWSTAADVRAFGMGSQLPVVVCRFSLEGKPVHALWYVEVAEADLSLHVSQSVAVYINADSALALKLAVSPAHAEERDVLVLRRQLQLDVCRRLISVAGASLLRNETLDGLVSDSVGFVAVHLLKAVAGHCQLTPEELAHCIDEHDSLVEAALQSLYFGGLQ